MSRRLRYEREERLSQDSSPTTAIQQGTAGAWITAEQITKAQGLVAAGAQEIPFTLMDATTQTTPLWQRLLGVLTEAELIHVGQCSRCMGLMEQLLLLLSMHVQAASGSNSTLARPASPPSAAREPDAAPSRSSAWIDRAVALETQLAEAKAYGENRNADYHGAVAQVAKVKAALVNVLVEMGGIAIHNSVAAGEAMAFLGAASYPELAGLEPASSGD